jgi:acetyl-CoA acetyltransferase family protein
MSRAPYALPKPARSVGNLPAYDPALCGGFVNPRLEAAYGAEPMGVTAENLTEMTGITRKAQDEFALASHQRAIAAIDGGKFAEEVLPVNVPQRKGEPIPFAIDERPRRDTSLEALSRLKPAFKPGGTVTAGNSSGLSDGAAVLLVMRAETAARLGYQPMARVVSMASAGVPPRVMGTGPIPATEKALARAGLTIDDIQLAEVNEAFAVQALTVMQGLGLRHELTNVNGGAVALGHPLGCSGARILTTLLHEMRRRADSAARPFYGLATLCVGVGQGEATIVEWLD